MELKLSNCTVTIKDSLTRRSELSSIVQSETKVKGMDNAFDIGLEMLKGMFKTFVIKIETENEVIKDEAGILDCLDRFDIMNEQDIEEVSRIIGDKVNDFMKTQELVSKQIELKKK